MGEDWLRVMLMWVGTVLALSLLMLVLTLLVFIAIHTPTG